MPVCACVGCTSEVLFGVSQQAQALVRNPCVVPLWEVYLFEPIRVLHYLFLIFQRLIVTAAPHPRQAALLNFTTEQPDTFTDTIGPSKFGIDKMSGMAQTNGAAATGSPADTKPVVIAAAFVVPGHTYGPLQVCTYLVEQGYHVYGIFGSHYEAAVVDAGIVYIENDFLPDPVYLKERDAILDPLQRVIGDMRNVFCTAIPGQHTLLKQTMARVREEHPSRPVVLLQELLYMGVLPFHCGAALPQGYESLPPVIGFSPFNRWYVYTRTPCCMPRSNVMTVRRII